MRTLSLLYRSFLGSITVATFAAAGVAQAQPIPNEDWEITGGTLTVETALGAGDTCAISGWGTSDASSLSGTVEDLVASPGGFLCNFVTISNLPWNTSYDTSGTPDLVTFHGASADTSVGDCRGDVTGEFTADSGSTSQSGSGEVVFDEQVWDDPNDNNDPCLLSGEISIEWPR